MKVFCTDFPLLTGRSLEEAALTDRLCLRGDHTLLNSGKQVRITSRMRGLSVMPQLVLRLSRAGKGFEERFADRYYREAAWGLAFADPEQVRERLARELDPALGYDFDGSLAVGHFIPLADLRRQRATLLETQGAVPAGETPLELPSEELLRRTVAALAQLFLLKTGDCVCFPLRNHYRPLRAGEQLFVAEGDHELLHIGIE